MNISKYTLKNNFNDKLKMSLKKYYTQIYRRTLLFIFVCCFAYGLGSSIPK